MKAVKCEPMFFFSCPVCGSFRVNRSNFEQALTSGKVEEMDGEIANGAVGAVVTFQRNCPRCLPRGRSAKEARALQSIPSEVNTRKVFHLL